MAHTPGEWILVENPDGLPYITDQKRRVIAFIRDMGADTDGNAALIKASPKLLAACKAAFATMDSDHPYFGQIRGAIAEAESK